MGINEILEAIEGLDTGKSLREGSTLLSRGLSTAPTSATGEAKKADAATGNSWATAIAVGLDEIGAMLADADKRKLMRQQAEVDRQKALANSYSHITNAIARLRGGR